MSHLATFPSTHARRPRGRLALRRAALAFLCALAWSLAPLPADASAGDPTLEQLGCGVSTLVSAIPVGGVVANLIASGGRLATCPSFLDAVGPSPPFDQWAAGCYPQLGSYHTCSWAAGNARVQEWISSGRALNGTIQGISMPEARLTCVYIVGLKGMFAPEAAQNQGGCTSGHFWEPPPPAPPPEPEEPDRRVPHTYRGTGYVCDPGGTTGVIWGGSRYFPEDFTADITPWEQDPSKVTIWDQGAPFAVPKSDICSTRNFVGPDFEGQAHVCAPAGTVGTIWGSLRAFANGFEADITPWDQDRDGYVVLWDQGAPFAVPRGDVCACGLGFELALALPPLLWLRGRRRSRRR